MDDQDVLLPELRVDWLAPSRPILMNVNSKPIFSSAPYVRRIQRNCRQLNIVPINDMVFVNSAGGTGPGMDVNSIAFQPDVYPAEEGPFTNLGNPTLSQNTMMSQVDPRQNFPYNPPIGGGSGQGAVRYS